MTQPTQKPLLDRLAASLMLEAVIRARKYSGEGRESFMQREEIQNGLLLNLIRLTETASRTKKTFRVANDLPWARMNDLRNEVLVHNYHAAPLASAWTFARDYLPILERRLARPKITDGS